MIFVSKSIIEIRRVSKMVMILLAFIYMKFLETLLYMMNGIDSRPL